MGFWLEVVTLVVPGFNDSIAELTAIAEFLADISLDIPWHVTAFHEDYKMFGQGHTTAAALQRAAGAGRAAGLRYVYAGNLSGQLGKLEDTHCPGCGATLVERRGFRVLRNRLTAEGACPNCAARIAGLWGGPPSLRGPALTRSGSGELLCSPPCG
jgi:pyruvate formate lyase activating enzyme